MDDAILDILRELTRLSSALKAWRGVVSEVLGDSRFFNGSTEFGRSFRPITQAWIDADKTAMTEFCLGLSYHNCLLFEYRF